MADELEEIDSLLARIPTIVCPKCGTDEVESFRLLSQSWTTFRVREFNPVNRTIYLQAVPIASSDAEDTRLTCVACDHEFAMPKGWRPYYS